MDTYIYIYTYLPQFAILYGNTPEYKTSSCFAYDYKNFDEAKFLADYKDIEKSFLNDDAIDLNQKFDIFLINLHNLIDKHYPKKNYQKGFET